MEKLEEHVKLTLRMQFGNCNWVLAFLRWATCFGDNGRLQYTNLEGPREKWEERVNYALHIQLWNRNYVLSCELGHLLGIQKYRNLEW